MGTRRKFLQTTTLAAAGMSLGTALAGMAGREEPGRIGLVGLDTSNSPAFAREINTGHWPFRVVAAYTTVSTDIPDSRNRVADFVRQIKAMGIPLAGSLADLLAQVDYVILNTLDGRLHVPQLSQILMAGKPVYINKPLAASFSDVKEIFRLAEKYRVPVMATSATRYITEVQAVSGGSIGRVLGADTYSPVYYEPTHPDLYWYAIHGIEMLYALLGTGCRKVKRTRTAEYDVLTGIWGDGRVGTYRGLRNGMQAYGGQAFGSDGVSYLGGFNGFTPFIEALLRFFAEKQSPVTAAETIEIYAFMTAAQRNLELHEEWTLLQDVQSD